MRSELNGILVVDKPADVTSAKVVAEVKKILGAAKVGHTGTLDPFATGVLLCCVNQATRLARFFLHGRKRYEAVLRLGAATDTQDATGRVVAVGEVPPLTDEEVASVFRRFEGKQMQQPPAFAALKHDGTPLYKLARQGRPVQKPPRPVTVALRILEVNLPDIRFDVSCSAGTYVRTLCADIGRDIGCGGHLVGLRRTESCGITLARAVSLASLKTLPDKTAGASFIPMSEALQGMPAIAAGEELLQHLRHGKALTADRLAGHVIEPSAAAVQAGGYLKVIDADGCLRAVLQAADNGADYNYCCVFN